MLIGVSTLRSWLPLIGVCLAGCATGPAPKPRSTHSTQRTLTRSEGRIDCPSGAFLLHAPDGWTLDEQVGQAHKIPVAFYPQHERWESARAVMFARCQAGPTSLAALVAEDKRRFRRLGSLMVTGEADPVRTSTGQRIDVRTFSGGAGGRNEAVAYILLSGGALRIVLRADSQSDFDGALPAFESLLGSCERNPAQP
jgi:hypothetical protein